MRRMASGSAGVSSKWFSRPGDERFPSLGDLAQTVWNRAERRKARVVETNLIHIEASRTDGELLSLILLGAEAPVGNGNLTASLGKKCTTQVLATLGR